MRRLYELSTSPGKVWKAFPAGDHNSSVLEEGYFEAITDFMADVTTASEEDIEEKYGL